MAFESEISAAIAQWGPTYGVTIDPALVRAIIQRESSGGLFSSAAEPGGHYSYGPMMVLDSTATSVLHVPDPRALTEPATGIWYGVQYLAQLLAWAGGDVDRAISAYNTGKGNAVRADDGTFPNQSYVTSVLGYWNSFARAAGAAAPVAVPLLIVLGALLFARARRRAA